MLSFKNGTGVLAFCNLLEIFLSKDQNLSSSLPQFPDFEASVSIFVARDAQGRQKNPRLRS